MNRNQESWMMFQSSDVLICYNSYHLKKWWATSCKNTEFPSSIIKQKIFPLFLNIIITKSLQTKKLIWSCEKSTYHVSYDTKAHQYKPEYVKTFSTIIKITSDNDKKPSKP